ncbi:hypothetical protein ACP4OV_017323 [Aristida adscensionis]
MAVALTLFLLLLFCISSPTARAAEDEQEYMVVAMSSLHPQDACSGHRVSPLQNATGMNWMPLHFPHGPCSSPSAVAAQTAGHAAPSSSLVDDLLLWDELRADGIQRRLPPGSMANRPRAPSDQTFITNSVQQQPAAKAPLGTASRGGQRASQLSIAIDPTATGGGGGVPGVVQTVVLDTASDVPWVQCVPCPVPPCHAETDTVYDPTTSPTYAAFPCSSPACARLGPYANGCVNNQCQYRVVYPDGSTTSGTYSSDVLTLTPTAAIRSFQFGCSHADQGNFDNTTAGILALGGGAESLVSQTAAKYGDTFSYCVPPTASYFGFFALGMARAESRYAVTPMLRYPQVPTFYRVLLRDIAVGGRRLGVPAPAFAAGAVLDTRTVFTRLPPTAYRALRAAFRSGMRRYRPAPPRGAFDTCYDLTGAGAVRLPRVALVFDRNTVVELDPAGILFNGCLAFVPNADDRMPGILGNLQLRTIEVLYDISRGLVGFRRGAC